METEMTSAIQRTEHEEFARRITEENDRQNHRLAVLEENTRRLEKLNVSIERLAVNMKNMLKEQLQQGKRLEQLEARCGIHKPPFRRIAADLGTDRSYSAYA